MDKMRFFLKINRHYKWKCLMLFLVFTFAGIVVSGALLVLQNNSVFYQSQLGELNRMTDDSLDFVYRQAENVLSIFSLASILIAAAGGFLLLLFKDLAMEKTFAICRLYGMKETDLIYKALADLVLYGIIAGILGGTGGYQLFRYLAVFVCETGVAIRFFSPSMAGVMLKELLILSTIAFFGSLISGKIPACTVLVCDV